MDREFKKRLQEKLDDLKKSKTPEPIRSDGAGALDLGPRNVMRDKENPDILVPPATDFGLIPNLRFSFSDAHMILKTGGWSREITSRELPVNNTMAVVDMNLSPGVREMHTHLQSEWGFVLEGGARITAVDERGRTFIADCKPGEGWIFEAKNGKKIAGTIGLIVGILMMTTILVFDIVDAVLGLFFLLHSIEYNKNYTNQ